MTCERANVSLVFAIEMTVSEDGVVLCWDAVPGKQYRVEQRSDINGEWEAASDTIFAPGTRICWATSKDPSASAMFFRVVMIN